LVVEAAYAQRLQMATMAQQTPVTAVVVVEMLAQAARH
jgi:hypothetical protein